MKNICIAVVLVALAACGGKGNPVAPAQPPVPACQANNTAEIRFENRSHNSVYQIAWDGTNICVLAPGEKSKSYTVAAGVQHTLDYFYANTNYRACTRSYPVLAQCETPLFYCTY